MATRQIPSPPRRSQSPEPGDSSEDEEEASRSIGYLAPSTIDLILFGSSTVLKYWDHDSEKKIVKKSSRSVHAEELMLNYIYRKGLMKELHDPNAIEMFKPFLQEAKRSLERNQIQLTAALKLKESRDQLYRDEFARQKFTKNTKKLEERRQKVDESEKDTTDLKKRGEDLEKTVENIHTMWKDSHEGKELKMKIVKELQNDIHESNGELSQRLRAGLPAEFWVSKSPCSKCSELLIQAYAGWKEKPTIHISIPYKGKRESLYQLIENSFKFKQWDLYNEYEEWKRWFEESDRYKKYQAQYERTRKTLEALQC